MATVNIEPPNDIYETFGRLNYKPWYAIAEFVDNATQNFYDHAQTIADSGEDALLDIEIAYEGSGRQGPSLTVLDNAHGMNLDELTRAMKLSARPPRTSGRSEFGMGMKTAGCWFGPRWIVKTSQLGDEHEYAVVFDVEALKKSKSKTIEVKTRVVPRERHYTQITIAPLYKPIAGRQINKIKQTLTSMYRHDLVPGTVEICWNGTPLEWTEPPLWQHERPDGALAPMRQSIDLEVEDPATGEQHRLSGWFGVLETMSSGAQNGFALFRRGRLIIGGPGEGWRPTELCGQSGSPEWKRIVGEINSDSFPVNFTKDGFDWEGGLEDALIETLEPVVSGYKIFARNLRVRDKDGAVTAKDFVRAVEEVNEGVKEAGFKRETAALAAPLPPGETREESVDSSNSEEVPAELEVPMPQGTIRAHLYIKDEGSSAPWLGIHAMSNDEVDIVLNTSHKFVESCVSDERGTIILSKIVLSLALAEQQARLIHGDAAPPDEIRFWLDKILLHTKPHD